MLALAAWSVIAAASAGTISGDNILAKVADASNRGLVVAYSGIREYRLRNLRFGKQAVVSVRVTYRPNQGKRFEVLERSGTPALVGIVDRILASEADESRPSNEETHEISPHNYKTQFARIETVGGRVCYAIGLKPRHKDKYLIDGTLWVDADSFAFVRLDGSTSTSVSMWVGTPHITQEFRQIAGVTVPTVLRSVSSSMWLGTSELEIRYSDYRIGDIEHPGVTNEATLQGALTGVENILHLPAGHLKPSRIKPFQIAFCAYAAFVVTPKITTRGVPVKSLQV